MFRKKIAGNGLFTGFAVRYGYGEAVFEQKIAKFGGTVAKTAAAGIQPAVPAASIPFIIHIPDNFPESVVFLINGQDLAVIPPDFHDAGVLRSMGGNNGILGNKAGIGAAFLRAAPFLPFQIFGKKLLQVAQILIETVVNPVGCLCFFMNEILDDFLEYHRKFPGI